MDKLFELLGLGTPFLYAAITLGFFRWLDSNISDEAKAAFAGLLNARHDSAFIPNAIVELFDRVYSYPLFTWRAFVRSAFITICVALIYAYEIDLWNLALSVSQGPFVAPLVAVVFLCVWVVPLLVGNITSDFISLFIVRRWLVTFGHRPILALIGSSLVFFIVIAISLVLRVIYYRFMVTVSGQSNRTDILMEPLNMLFAPAGFMIPALAVFIWLPLFGISISLVRAVNLLGPLVSKVQWLIKGARPLDAVGYVAAGIVFFGTLLWRHLRPEAVAQHAMDYGIQLASALQ